MWHRYRLLTRWRCAAPAESVWNAILHSEGWPRWWPQLESVHELERGRDGGVGNLRRYRWRTPFGYRLSFTLQATRVEPLRLLEGAASGDVRGWGRWHFDHLPACTDAVYEWDVEVARRSMRLLSAVAHPLFVWSHHHLMRSGAQGLSHALGCRVAFDVLASGADGARRSRRDARQWPGAPRG